MAFANIDGETWTIIAGIGTALGGALYRFWGWLKARGNDAIAYAKPKVDEFLEKHNSLIDTLKETQVQGTAAINKISDDMHQVRTNIEANSVVLARIQENTCKTPPQQAKGTEVSNA